MANENENNGQGLQLELKPEIAVGVYSNLVMINHSSSDFILDFASFLPGMPKAQIASRVLMAPEHAKRLLLALQDNIHKYEQQFGKIQLPELKGATIAPFGKGNGEA
ncbi:MAG: DUF3467 domain-containing protein [Prevotella sp.]|jgi:hypothetical protein|nr:DUF3467 domain-containing protein [Prevotella sp.]